MQDKNFENHSFMCFAFPEFRPLRLYAYGIRKIFRADDLIPYDSDRLNEYFRNRNWQVGWIGYGLKSHIANLPHQKNEFLQYDLCWIEPEILFLADEKVEEVIIGEKSEAKRIFENINQADSFENQMELTSQTEFSEYLQKFTTTMRSIQRGDIYEANLCIPFDFKAQIKNPYTLWRNSLDTLNAPFSCYVHYGYIHALSFSPERFIKKSGSDIISQPIKGTIAASDHPEEDKIKKETLLNSFKDLTENRMVVDLIRNDLCRICEPGSVIVNELASIKSFPGLHHLVSEVKGTLKDVGFSKILRATFPMASMTGIPKHKMMVLMDEIENSPRGLYSGSIGYKKPNGDFDFNVVIRTLLYDHSQGKARINAGGAITSQSHPRDEYTECQTKIKRLLQALCPSLDTSVLGGI